MCKIGSHCQCKLALTYHKVRQGIPKTGGKLTKRRQGPDAKSKAAMGGSPIKKPRRSRLVFVTGAGLSLIEHQGTAVVV